jgi:predicted HicB family RNase H-like nuclease
MTVHKNTIAHRGFTGSVEYDDSKGLLYGVVDEAKPKIKYSGTSVAELKKVFQAAVDDYLANSKQSRPKLTGSFNVRIGAELHKLAMLRAKKDRTSINKVVIAALTDYLA